MNSRLRKGLIAALIAVAGMTVGVGVVDAVATAPVSGGPAGAGPCAAQAATARVAVTPAALRAFGDCEIERRIVALGRLSAAVDASTGLTPADAAALTSDIDAARSGLTALKTTIDGQARIAPLRAAILKIVTGYRVYVLLGPQVRLTIAADGVLALKPHFDSLSSTLAVRIAKAHANGKDVTAAQAALDAMNAAVARAQVLASPLPARLLALTPAGFTTGGAAELRTARVALVGARDYLKAAAQDGRTVLADLK